jgi:hypothetical protein
MKAYVNVLILFWIYYTNVLTRKEYWSHEYVSNQSIGMTFQYTCLIEMQPKVRALQDSFIAYDLGVNYEGYDTYLVYMEIKGGSLSATYNENGKLISVVENYKSNIA